MSIIALQLGVSESPVQVGRGRDGLKWLGYPRDSRTFPELCYVYTEAEVSLTVLDAFTSSLVFKLLESGIGGEGRRESGFKDNDCRTLKGRAAILKPLA